MAQYILQEHRVDARTDPTAWATLRARAEKLKLALSQREQASLDLNDVVRGEGGAFLPVSFTMTRDELEALAAPLVSRTLETCRFSLETIGMGVKDLGRLILVGGATRMPLVARKAEEFFGRPAAIKVNPDEVVALGAAIQAYSLNRAEAAIAARRAPTSIIRTAPPTSEPSSPPTSGPSKPPTGAPLDSGPPVPDLPLVTGSGAIPLSWAQPPKPPKPPPLPQKTMSSSALPAAGEPSRSFASSAASPLGSRSLLGDAPKAGGGARPSASPGGYSQTSSSSSLVSPASPPSAVPPAPAGAPLLIDVTPISLGVEVAGGYTDMLIMANTPVPCDRARVFRTASDGQTNVLVRVAQGEAEKFALNTCLGDIELSGLKAAARGEVQIEVVFEIDVDGILNVKAKDLESGRETAAKMRLLGTDVDPANLQQMMSRQARHALG
jgi:molecular chaperone DnaK